MVDVISQRILGFRLLGVDVFCLTRKFLVFNLVSKNLKLKYRQSYLGIFWTMIGPITTTFMYYLIFKFVIKVQIENYLLFVLSGILPWTFFATTLTQGMESIVSHQQLINKTPIPSLAFPLAETLTAFINLLLSLPVLLVVAVVTLPVITTAHLWLIPIYGLIFLQAYSLALIFSVLFVFFRDLRHIFANIMPVWFYSTPIMYDLKMVPAEFKDWFWLNPLAHLFDDLHNIMIHGQFSNYQQLYYNTAWTVLILFFAAFLYSKLAPQLPENL